MKIGDVVLTALEDNDWDELPEDWKPDDEWHDCHLVGGGGESGCDHPSHREYE